MNAASIRIRIEVRGQVQGVGFRPFVHRLASGIGLGGWVRNVGAGVEIEVEGGREPVERFVARLHTEAPAAARIEQLSQTAIALCGAGEPFAIAASNGAATSAFIAPRRGRGGRCIGELCDRESRGYRHPVAHCTDCGPRCTITARLPYDRVNTSMAAFDECPACRAEREQPNERRFHAQTNACADCGPRLFLLDASGAEPAPGDPIGDTDSIRGTTPAWPLPSPPRRSLRPGLILVFAAVAALITVGIVSVVSVAVGALAPHAPPAADLTRD